MHQRALVFSKLLKSCSHPSHLHQLHARMLKSGLDRRSFPASKLLAAAVLIDTSHAVALFDQFDDPNLFLYNTMLRGYSIARHPELQRPISIFNSMRARVLPLDQFSFITVLKICSRVSTQETGRQIHGIIIHSGFHSFVNVMNTLVHFYCACGRIVDAQRIFDEIPQIRDVVSWTVLTGGYVKIGELHSVKKLFIEMRANNVDVSAGAIVSVLSALIDAQCLDASLHGFCIKCGFYAVLNIATAIATMYAKFGCMDSAKKVFDAIASRDVVLYNATIDGYARDGIVDEALSLLQQMEGEGVRPNKATFVGLLSSCASSGALTVGRWIHQYIDEKAIEFDAVLGTALINMYSKCGCLDEAMKIFDWIQDKDVKTWTAMIMGFGVNGQADAALELFYKMEGEGMRPNEITFLAVLSACSHCGMVAAGKKLFERMVRDYGLCPKIEHYGCVIDLLGRVGLLEEAHELIRSLPSGGDATAWRAFLAACKVHGNAELGELALQTLMKLENEHASDLILLSGAYATEDRWMDVARMRDSEGERMVAKKEAGWSSIELVG